MLVSNNPLLNILLPNDNKVLKEVLKEADSKTLEQMLKNNSASVNDVLKELFDGLKNGTKSNTSIENILKNSTVFKEMGTVTNNLSTLLDDISQDENLQKFKPIIENFLKNIKDMDSNTLKEQISKSGVFLEAKMNQTSNTKVENILNQIQNLVKDIDTPQAKQINELLTKTIQNPNSSDLSSNLKALTSSLQNLNTTLNTPQTQNLSSLTNQLKEFITNGALVESKLENNSTLLNTQTKEVINTQTKELLGQIKNDLVQNPSIASKNIMPMLENLLKMDNLFVKGENIQNLLSQNNISTFTNNFSSNLSPLLTSLKENLESLNPNNSSLQTHISKLVETVENLIKDLANPRSQANNISDDMKSVLLQMQNELASKEDPKSQEMAKQIDKLLTQIDYHQLASLTSNSNNIYLPFFWEMLDDGNITMKKTDEDKFYCQINLTLKDFGKVDLMLAMYDTNKIDLTIYAQREHFKTAIRDNMQELKIALNNVDLIPVNIKLLDLKEEQEEKKEPTQVYMENSYSQTISSSIDIRA
jgi:hypothetical protein